MTAVKFHDCTHNAALSSNKDPCGSIIKSSSGSATALQICNLSKEDLAPSKDSKFSSGIHVSCPYLGCSMKNSQFQHMGRFPAEFLLNHLHSNHKHRRFNGDSLDLTMVVPQLDYEITRRSVSHPSLTANGVPSTPATATPMSAQVTMQTWPFVEIYSHKKYFYLEAQSHTIDGHAELFLWLWFLGTESEELHYRYHLIVIHGKSEYSYKGPVTSMTKGANDIRNEGRCLVIREKVWDYMSYRLKITKH